MGDCRSIQGDHHETLQNVLTEEEVGKLTGLSKSQLSNLRQNEKLPFLKINRNCRLYLESDLVRWLTSRKTVLNEDEDKF